MPCASYHNDLIAIYSFSSNQWHVKYEVRNVSERNLDSIIIFHSSSLIHICYKIFMVLFRQFHLVADIIGSLLQCA